MKALAAVVCGLTLLSCEHQTAREEVKPETESGMVAPIEELQFSYLGASYDIMLRVTQWGIAGDLTVTGFDPAAPEGAPARLAAVAVAVCQSEGRVFDSHALVRTENDNRVSTFVEACR